MSYNYFVYNFSQQLQNSQMQMMKNLAEGKHFHPVAGDAQWTRLPIGYHPYPGILHSPDNKLESMGHPIMNYAVTPFNNPSNNPSYNYNIRSRTFNSANDPIEALLSKSLVPQPVPQTADLLGYPYAANLKSPGEVRNLPQTIQERVTVQSPITQTKDSPIHYGQPHFSPTSPLGEMKPPMQTPKVVNPVKKRRNSTCGIEPPTKLMKTRSLSVEVPRRRLNSSDGPVKTPKWKSMTTPEYAPSVVVNQRPTKVGKSRSMKTPDQSPVPPRQRPKAPEFEFETPKNKPTIKEVLILTPESIASEDEPEGYMSIHQGNAKLLIRKSDYNKKIKERKISQTSETSSITSEKDVRSPETPEVINVLSPYMQEIPSPLSINSESSDGFDTQSTSAWAPYFHTEANTKQNERLTHIIGNWDDGIKEISLDLKCDLWDPDVPYESDKSYDNIIDLFDELHQPTQCVFPGCKATFYGEDSVEHAKLPCIVCKNSYSHLSISSHINTCQAGQNTNNAKQNVNSVKKHTFSVPGKPMMRQNSLIRNVFDRLQNH